MRYQFREESYQGRTIRFIKALGVNSDGLAMAPAYVMNVMKYISTKDPDIIVIGMIGYSGTSSSTSDAFTAAFLKQYRRLPDHYYAWKEAAIEDQS
ncbi:hypothetical protein [Hymenobacter sp. GOD-10R]|uniref:hypothetical protein n=1 Tax=Hymenobacter sp. GOD-10R TaxID=3093922 RepID=UPI002D773DCE|nr:hypothetical protein [Hymenobacter sp. GOD-10R]WRQ29145.1 hypothetical protein SD425_02565 [Hymenobacter sp. GOD-10R]